MDLYYYFFIQIDILGRILPPFSRKNIQNSKRTRGKKIAKIENTYTFSWSK